MTEDEDIDSLMNKVSNEIRDIELNILDEFCKAFFASQFLNGHDLIDILSSYELIQEIECNGSVCTIRSYFKIIEETR